jgi:septum formation protein
MLRRRIVLASGSPRRRELLATLGVAFDVLVSDVDETVDEHRGPVDFVLQLARRKARVGADRAPDALVIGGDTMVELDGQIFGKPADSADAAATLRRLSGRAHRVVTGLAVVDATTGTLREGAATSTVLMREIGDDEIEGYVATGEPFGKAGSYALQGLGGRFVTSVDGDRDTVLGLSTRTLRRLLADFGVQTELAAG